MAADGHVVREDAELAHHVDLPDFLGLLAGLQRAMSQADDFAAVGAVPDAPVAST